MRKFGLVVCGDNPLPVPGRRHLCDQCKCPIFICDTSFEAIKENGYFESDFHFVCVACARKLIGPQTKVVPRTELQKKEIEQFL